MGYIILSIFALIVSFALGYIAGRIDENNDNDDRHLNYF